jgi:hypothetical protein
LVVRGLSLVSLGLLLSACFDLTKVDPGPRYIDDFDHGNLTPSWAAFGKWQCGTFMGGLGSDRRVGQDAGADAGAKRDPDGSVSCQPEQPGDTDQYALRATFELNEPTGAGQQPGAAIVTRTARGTSVDITGYTQLWFSAHIESAPPLTPVVAGTLEVELGCSSDTSDPLAFQSVDLMNMKLDSSTWPAFQFNFALDTFERTKTQNNQDCFQRVDSLHFTIMPVLPSGASTGGALHVDNINLQ